MEPVSAILAVGSTTATTITQINDVKKRRELESTLALMSATERADLERDIAASQDKNQRINILINAIQAARNAQAEREQRTQTVKWVLIGVFGLGTLITIAWFLKK
jgi:hypothetical protein